MPGSPLASQRILAHQQQQQQQQQQALPPGYMLAGDIQRLPAQVAPGAGAWPARAPSLLSAPPGCSVPAAIGLPLLPAADRQVQDLPGAPSVVMGAAAAAMRDASGSGIGAFAAAAAAHEVSNSGSVLAAGAHAALARAPALPGVSGAGTGSFSGLGVFDPLLAPLSAPLLATERYASTSSSTASDGAAPASDGGIHAVASGQVGPKGLGHFRLDSRA